MKKFLTLLTVIIGAISFAFGVSFIPKTYERHKINENKIAQNFNPKIYQSWVN